MTKPYHLAIGFALASVLSTACEPAPPATPSEGTASSASASAAVAASAPTFSSHAKLVKWAGRVIGTTVRFTAGSSSVEVAIDQDNPAVRDFLSMLPLTLKLEEFASREKIGYLPRKLDVNRAPGSDPKDGDLIYYVPWGNVGFYYNAAGIGYSDKTIHLGTYKASRDQLKQLEGQSVIIDVVR
ncbi:MAG: hypothetical protein EPN73_22705 [Paraburkholderia sp.]|uniref:cyclophilin-like fold protein n=1 Tax=Paraburkholderia sp. TaxID=1926495 RepID=UPI00121F709C|nr:cyclophilin-like fold protein [Paraburkholderia sp.]TAL93181.1 MAG: hypothetical protein EPN73_22705 [Paraburkholderia sp.]